MTQKYHGNRRRNSASTTLLTAGVLLFGFVGGTFLLHATGTIELPFLRKEEPEPPKRDLSGLIRVPRSARAIPAYEAVSRDDLWDPQQGSVSTVYLRPEDVSDQMITELGSIMGRVLKREKPRGYVFLESDFYPTGTRPGPTAGVPPGKRAMRLRASEVPGLHGLNQGDRFDLVMTVSVELEQPPLRAPRHGSALDVEGPYAALHVGQALQGEEEPVRVKRKHAEVRTIVRNGQVVQPIHQRKEISKTASLLKGATLQATPIEELVIAVAPEEVAELNLALAVGASLLVAMRSGQVNDATDEGEIPDIKVALDDEVEGADTAEEVTETVRVVEVIKGGEKHLHAVPTRRPDADEGKEAQ